MRCVLVLTLCLSVQDALGGAHRKLKLKDTTLASANGFRAVRRQALVRVTYAPPPGCDDTQFRCRSGDCVPAKWTCDTENDCGDNSDETLPECPSAGQCTGSHRFGCANGRCVPTDVRCDGDNDCGDFSDERGCDLFQCNAGEWKCANSRCVERAFLCDGDNDCGDRSDERPVNCPIATLFPPHR